MNLSRTQLGAAPLVLALACGVTVILCAMDIADQREGHAWCDGAAIAVHQPVNACMAQWNTFGANGVVRWAKANLPAD